MTQLPKMNYAAGFSRNRNLVMSQSCDFHIRNFEEIGTLIVSLNTTLFR